MGSGLGGFDMMFSVFPVVFFLVFAIIIVVFIVTAVKGVSQWHKNNESPVLTVAASVVTKRTSVTRHIEDEHSMGHSSTSYYATFQVASGDRMEFSITGTEYGQLAEGDQGGLTFQGTRYLGFDRSV